MAPNTKTSLNTSQGSFSAFELKFFLGDELWKSGNTYDSEIRPWSSDVRKAKAKVSDWEGSIRWKIWLGSDCLIGWLYLNHLVDCLDSIWLVDFTWLYVSRLVDWFYLATATLNLKRILWFFTLDVIDVSVFRFPGRSVPINATAVASCQVVQDESSHSMEFPTGSLNRWDRWYIIT